MIEPLLPLRAVWPVRMFLPIVCFLLAFAQLSAQVVIREKVDILPSVRQEISADHSSSATSTVPSLKIIYEWRSTSAGYIRVWGPCGLYQTVEGPGKGLGSPARLELVIRPAPVGWYGIIVNSYGSVCGEWYRVEDHDGNVLGMDHSGWSCRIDPAKSVYFGYPNSFRIFADPYSVRHGGGTLLFLDPVWEECRAFPFSGPILLSIVRGSRFGEFKSVPDNAPLGHSVTLASLTNHFKIRFEANGEPPSAPGDTVEIRAVGGGIEKRILLAVTTEGPYPKLNVSVEPDTIPMGGTTTVFVQALDLWGRDLSFSEIPADARVSFVAIIGSLPDFQGNTIERNDDPMRELLTDFDPSSLTGIFMLDGIGYPEYLSEVPYRDANLGKVSLRVEGAVSDQTEEILITIAAIYFVDGEGPTISTTHLLVTISTFDHFLVTAERDTIVHGETASLFIQAKDKEGKDVELPGGTLLNVVLRADEKYASLAYGGRKGLWLDNVPYEDARKGNVWFVVDGENPIDLEPQKVDVGVTGEGKSGSGSVVVKGIEPELIVLRPVPGSADEKITSAPQMPQLQAQAQLKNFTGGTVTFDWTLVVKWTSPEPREISDVFHGATQAQNSGITQWNITLDNKIRGGNDVRLFVVATARGRNYISELRNPFRILGENPSVAEVKQGLSLQEQVVVYLESFPKWKHFKADGFPIFGDPHGYGLMQLDDPRATDEQVWNWRENKAGGVVLLQQKRTDAEGYPGRIRAKARRGALSSGYLNTPNFSTDELLWKETFQRYNGGAYWWWHPVDPDNPVSPGEWKPIPSGSGYGAKAWDTYINVLSGRPPAGWN